MKKLLLSLVALLGAIAVNAQVVSETISATLQNGETTTVYYGTDALKTALNNAVDGSIITLSSGTFSTPGNITKSVKIYGAGYENDPVTGVARTFLDGGINMSGVEGVHVDNFYMEGLYVNGAVYIADAGSDELIEGVKLVKCRTTNILSGRKYRRQQYRGIRLYGSELLCDRRNQWFCYRKRNCC